MGSEMPILHNVIYPGQVVRTSQRVNRMIGSEERKWEGNNRRNWESSALLSFHLKQAILHKIVKKKVSSSFIIIIIIIAQANSPSRPLLGKKQPKQKKKKEPYYGPR